MPGTAAHVLLVDDDQAHVQLVRRAFVSRGNGMDLTTVGTLAQARARLAEAPPDLLITDLLLPDGRGTVLLSGGEQDRPFPVVVMTAYGDEHVAVEAMKAGALDYVVKSNAALADMPHIALRALREWEHITERQRAERKAGELREQLLHAQRLEAIGRLAGGVAHDFNNQLMVIQGYCQLLMRAGGLEPDNRTMLEEIRRAADRSARLTGELLAFSRKQTLRPTVNDLNEVLARMQGPLSHMLGEDVELAVVLAEDLRCVHIDRALFEQAVMNLAINARDAMPAGGRLTIATANADLDAGALPAPAPPAEANAAQDRFTAVGPHVRVTVTDTGCGMDELTCRRVFEPFFTTKEVARGTGLGLSMVYGFVRQSGGAIDVTSRPGRGATFRILLPAAGERPQRPPATAPARPKARPRGTETILVAEDEEPVRHFVARVLRQCGYTVLEAGSAREALPLGTHYEGRIDLLMTDMVMPGMQGGELAARLGRVRPKIKVLYMSGHGESAFAGRGGAGTRRHALLRKPFSAEVLAQTVRRRLDGTPGRPVPTPAGSAMTSGT